MVTRGNGGACEYQIVYKMDVASGQTSIIPTACQSLTPPHFLEPKKCIDVKSGGGRYTHLGDIHRISPKLIDRLV